MPWRPHIAWLDVPSIHPTHETKSPSRPRRISPAHVPKDCGLLLTRAVAPRCSAGRCVRHKGCLRLGKLVFQAEVIAHLLFPLSGTGAPTHSIDTILQRWSELAFCRSRDRLPPMRGIGQSTQVSLVHRQQCLEDIAASPRSRAIAASLIFLKAGRVSACASRKAKGLRRRLQASTTVRHAEISRSDGRTGMIVASASLIAGLNDLSVDRRGIEDAVGALRIAQ